MEMGGAGLSGTTRSPRGIGIRLCVGVGFGVDIDREGWSDVVDPGVCPGSVWGKAAARRKTAVAINLADQRPCITALLTAVSLPPSRPMGSGSGGASHSPDHQEVTLP
jgi:hypothetical protein